MRIMHFLTTPVRLIYGWVTGGDPVMFDGELNGRSIGECERDIQSMKGNTHCGDYFIGNEEFMREVREISCSVPNVSTDLASTGSVPVAEWYDNQRVAASSK